MRHLTPAEQRLVGKLLDMAADEFGNHGSNDLEWGEFPVEEREALIRKMEHDNNPDHSRREEIDESVQRYTRGKYGPGDSWLMRYFSRLFLGESRDGPSLPAEIDYSIEAGVGPHSLAAKLITQPVKNDPTVEELLAKLQAETARANAAQNCANELSFKLQEICHALKVPVHLLGLK